MKHPRPKDIQEGKIGTALQFKAGKYHTLFEIMRKHPRFYLYMLVDFNGQLEAHYIADLNTYTQLLRGYQANQNARIFAAYRLSAAEHDESK